MRRRQTLRQQPETLDEMAFIQRNIYFMLTEWNLNLRNQSMSVLHFQQLVKQFHSCKR